MSSWAKNFPDGVETPENSRLFLARMNYIAVASIFVHRGVVPKDIVVKRHVQGVVFYSFNKETLWGKKLHDMMCGIRDGLTKQYVREVQVVFGKSAENPKEIIEMYSLKFSYGDQDEFEITDGAGRPVAKIGYRGMDAFRTQVLSLLLRILEVTGALQKLPKGMVPKVQVLFDQHAPSDYICPMFRHSDDVYGFQRPVEPFAIGRLDTNHGSMFMSVQSLLMPGTDLQELEQTVENRVAAQMEKISEKQKSNLSARSSKDNSVAFGLDQNGNSGGAKIEKTSPGKPVEPVWRCSQIFNSPLAPGPERSRVPETPTCIAGIATTPPGRQIQPGALAEKNDVTETPTRAKNIAKASPGRQVEPVGRRSQSSNSPLALGPEKSHVTPSRDAQIVTTPPGKQIDSVARRSPSSSNRSISLLKTPSKYEPITSGSEKSRFEVTPSRDKNIAKASPGRQVVPVWRRAQNFDRPLIPGPEKNQVKETPSRDKNIAKASPGKQFVPVWRRPPNSGTGLTAPPKDAQPQMDASEAEEITPVAAKKSSSRKRQASEESTPKPPKKSTVRGEFHACDPAQ